MRSAIDEREAPLSLFPSCACHSGHGSIAQGWKKDSALSWHRLRSECGKAGEIYIRTQHVVNKGVCSSLRDSGERRKIWIGRGPARIANHFFARVPRFVIFPFLLSADSLEQAIIKGSHNSIPLQPSSHYSIDFAPFPLLYSGSN